MPSGRDGAITITGGAGSSEAHYDDMLTSARLVDAAGDSARSLNSDLIRAMAGLPAAGIAMSPGSAVHLAAQSAELTIGSHGLIALGLELEVMARGIRLSVQYYQVKDATIAETMTAIRFTVAIPHIADAMTGCVLNAAAPTVRDYATARLKDPLNPKVDPLKAYQKYFLTSLAGRVHDDPSLTDDTIRSARIIAALTFSKDNTFEGQAAALLGIATRHGYLLDSKKLTVTDAGVTTTDQPRRDNIGTLLGDEAKTEGAGNAHWSQVRVHRRVDPQGLGHWVIDVPGTEEWDPKMPPNPSDATANVRSMAGRNSTLYAAIGTALTAAMRKSGITPGTEPVMLVGHSQGGIVAARLAANPQFRTRFNITHLLTVASPESRIRIPKSVQALSIEHRADPVPRLDTIGRTDGVNRTRAFVDPASQMRPGDKNPLSQHDGKLYAKTAEKHLGRDNDDPLLRRWYADTEGFMNGTDTRYDFDVSRPATRR